MAKFFAAKTEFKLLFRGSRDQFTASSFHSKCDGKGATLTVIKVEQGNRIFGGFTNIPWDSSSVNKTDCHQTFLFKLNNDNSQFEKFDHI